MGIVKETYDTIGELSKAIRDFRLGLTVSLPAFLKSTNIMSRVYIEEKLYEEEILLPLIGLANQMYAGFVMTALQLNQYVTNSRNVRNVLELVATEDYEDSTDIIHNEMHGTNIHTEDNKVLTLEQKEQKLVSGRVIELDLHIEASANGTVSNINQTIQGQKGNQTNINMIQEKGPSVTKVLLYVQLIPYLITTSIVEQVITLHTGNTKEFRRKKAKAGEISFFWDYLFERDLITDQTKALKEDRTGMLYKMLKQSNNSLSKALLRFVNIAPENHNLANTILILDNSTFKTACSKSGVDFTHKATRDKFFKETFIMMVMIVDTNYNNVTIYFNGLDTKGDYSFKMIQANSGAGSHGSDKYDLKDIMTALSTGMSPKF